MSKTINLGAVTAYADAVAAGYTGTREQFAQDLANAATYAAESHDSAETASAAAETASTAATTATTAAASASDDATTAHADAEAALSFKESAETAAGTATTKAGEAANSASQAATSASGAAGSATAASGSATAAAGSASDAAASETAAAGSATAAAGSASAAAQTLIDVNAAGATQVAAIGAKGEEVLESIPADYTTLSNDVDDLKSNLNNRVGGLIPATMTDGKFVQSNGQLADNAGSSASNFIPVETGRKYLINNLYLSGTRCLVAYNLQTASVTEVILTGSSDTSVVYTVPNGVTHIRGTAKSGQTMGVYLDDAFSEIDGLLDVTSKIGVDLETKATKQEAIKLKTMYPANCYGVGMIKKYPFPDSAFNNIGVKIFTDERSFFTDYMPETHKNSGGTTYYFSPTGANGNDGLTPQTPKKDVSNVTQVNGDTYVLMDGFYTRNCLASITKSVNIVAQHSGNVVVNNSDNNYTYTLVEGTTYSASRTNVVSVLVKAEENYVALAHASSIDNCKATPFSFYSDTTLVYVNTGGIITPNNENTFLNLSLNRPLWEVTPDTGNVNVYLEGITFIGGSCGGLVAKNTASYSVEVHAYKCNFYGAYNTTTKNYDAVSILGGKAYFKECEASYSRKDGFNYHAQNNVVPLAVEIDCVAKCNGTDGDGYTNNGSTAHDGAVVIRVNGVYHDNIGANVADVHNGTKTLNLRCVAYDSHGNPSQGANADFSAQQASAIMWLDRCKTSGDSDYSIYSYSGTSMYLHKCDYKNTQGGGTIVTDWNPYG